MDKDEVRKLYEQYGSWIFNRAKGLLKDEELAWEAVQDVFLKVLEKGSEFRGESSPWTWLYRITTNHCLNLIRSQKSWQKALEGLTREQIRPFPGPEDPDYSVLIDRESLVKFIEREDEMTQRIILAYYVDEMTQEEMTTMFKISRKTIYKRLKKFHEKVRKGL